MDSEHLDWVALAWAGPLGPVQFHRLVARFGSPGAVLAASARELLAAGLRDEQVPAVRRAGRTRSALRKRLEALARSGVRVLCSYDKEYPESLRISPLPPVITLVGEVPKRDEDSVAIVGTRTCSPEGFEFAREFARELAKQDVWVVSGLALGIDTAAHLGALDAGGRTLGILGSGVDVVYPRANRMLAARIPEGGGLLSEQPPGARPNVARLMARNRLQAAMSKAVVVIEARSRGGSLVTAGYARKQGRLVFACEWGEEKEEAIGTRRLLAEGARPVRSPGDAEWVLAAVRGWCRPAECDAPEQSKRPTQMTIAAEGLDLLP